MTPDTFLARLSALVPPPRAHTVLYYGVLSAHHPLRSAVVPSAGVDALGLFESGCGSPSVFCVCFEVP